MKLTFDEVVRNINRLWEITVACYKGVERPDRPTFERLMARGDVFVYPNEAIGYALVTPDTSPLLVSLAVMPVNRGCGFGKELLWEVSTYYRQQGRQEIILHCKPDNPAQILYFKEGYRVTAYLRNYYKPEGDGLEMRKIL